MNRKMKRQSYGLSLKDIAKVAGVSEALVSMFENGNVNNEKLKFIYEDDSNVLETINYDKYVRQEELKLLGIKRTAFTLERV